jgi:hypothetical protein
VEKIGFILVMDESRQIYEGEVGRRLCMPWGISR